MSEHQHEHHHAGCSCGAEHHHHHAGCSCESEHHHHDGCSCGAEHHHHQAGCSCESEHHHHHDGCGCGSEHHHHHDGCGCGSEHHHHHDGCGCGHHHEHHDVDTGANVQFVGTFEVDSQTLWKVLTENASVKQWYPELEFEAVETGATLRFNYPTGGCEEMMVLDVEPPHFLSFTWDLNIVTFELKPVTEAQTDLVFTIWLPEVNDHTPKDLTGWMIALQSMAEVIEAKPVSDREEKFHQLYPSIKQMLEQQMDMEFED